MKIAVVVHGRFHGFDLARELSRRHEVTVFTNYPGWAAARSGLRLSQVRSFWPHGVVSRVAWWLHQRSLPYPEAALHRLFGRWAAAQVTKERWDVVHCFSGVSEEVLLALKGRPITRMVVRGSAHIRAQARLLEEEEHRTGTRLDRPSRWMISREEREYALADRIVVLSSFARNSFLAEGTTSAKLGVLPLGASIEMFRPSREVVEARCRRILSGEPLRVLYVGGLSLRKGLWDVASILRSVANEKLRFRFVGPVTAEAHDLIKELRSVAEFFPKQPQKELSQWYAWGDLFMFPTIEDGFAVVLAQAHASALPILTTTNCCGPDLIRDGETGWVLPIRSPDAFVERLRWCDAHRGDLADVARHLYYHFRPRTWADVAGDFESLCAKTVAADGR
jgi:glycosyltransferase involved in cell wall biosynthesis